MTIEVSIPHKGQSRESNIVKYCDYLAAAHDLKNPDIPQVFAGIGEHLNLTLRQLEKGFSNFALTASSFNSNSLYSAPLLIALCIIKTTNPKLFIRLQSKNIGYTEIFKSLNYTEDTEDDNFPMTHAMTWFKGCLMSDAEYLSFDLGSPERKIFDRTHIRSRREFFDATLDKVRIFNVN
ncbi:hypothetical protein [Pseudomonas sp. NPDC086251]|uniref:hypothetical protein n=1 Tax=Pseudomonas sp. NPDC086251 TaxID=3364431 RepID=UPI0038388846